MAAFGHEVWCSGVERCGNVGVWPDPVVQSREKQGRGAERANSDDQ